MDASILSDLTYGIIGVVLFLLPLIVTQRRKTQHTKHITWLTFGSFVILIIHIYFAIALWLAALIWSFLDKK